MISDLDQEQLGVTRFWARTSARVLLDEDGFLLDPLATYSVQPDEVVSTADITDIRAAVLLGPMGAGKSYEVANSLISPTNETAFFDLAQFGSDWQIANELFQEAKIRDWVEGDYELTLVLDSFGDARTRIPNLPRSLEAAVAKLPTDRLWLRIASRDSLWPASLTDGLFSRFADGVNCRELHLQPIRRTDIPMVCTELAPGADMTDHVEAIYNGQALSLATRPLTLRMVVDLYEQTGRLPERRADLYREAIQLLVTEADTAREDAIVGATSIPIVERVAIAQRIAAHSLLGGFAALSRTSPPGEAMLDLSIHFDGAEELLESTSLFTVAGSGGFRFYHSSIEEYLCAGWLSEELTQDQVQSILLAPGGRVWKPYAGVARWLVARDPDHYGDLVAADPVVFSSGFDLPEHLRELIVNGLLEDPHSYDWWRDRLGDLRNPALPEILRNAISHGDDEQVLMAVRLAALNEVNEILPDILGLALDQSCRVEIREMAAHAVSVVGTDRGQLAPILDEDPPAQSSLYGLALDDVWPEQAGPQEIFDLLLVPGRGPGSSYGSFLERLGSKLDESHLGPGLAWLNEHEQQIPGFGAETSLANSLLAAGMLSSNIDHLATTAMIVAKRADRFEDLWFENLEQDRLTLEVPTEQLRALVLEVIAVAPDGFDPSRLCWMGASRSALVGPSSFAWLLDEFSQNEENADSFLGMANMVFDPDSAEHKQLVDGLDESHPIRQYPRLAPPDPDSEMGRFHREYEQQERERAEADSALATENQLRFVDELRKFEDGEGDIHFVQAVHSLLNASRRGIHRVDLPSLSSWSRLRQDEVERLLSAGMEFLNSASSDIDDWIDRPVVHYRSQAAIAVLVSMLRVAPERLKDLSATAWLEWAPAIATHSWVSLDGMTRAEKLTLIDLAAQNGATSAMRAAVVARLPVRLPESWRRFPLSEAIEILFDSTIESALLDMAKTAQDVELFGSALRMALRCGSSEAHQIAIERVQSAADPAMAKVALIVMLANDLVGVWTQLTVGVAVDEETLREALLEYGVLSNQVVDVASNEPALLAQLYLDFDRLFPPVPLDPDEFNGMAKLVSPSDEAADFNPRLMRRLFDDGSSSSVEALELIARGLDDDRSKGILSRSAELAHTNSFRALDSDHLRKLVADGDASLVQTEQSLAKWISTALDRVQVELTGARPQSQFLWNTALPSGSGHRPKQEDEISDFLDFRLCELLRGKLVVVNRELQLRRNAPGGIGERTDLLVQASYLDTDVLSHPLEVKGAWHDDLLTAMKDQLIDRYMADLGCTEGTYVVIWPDFDKWDDSDTRKRKVAQHDQPDVKRTLEAQAAEMLSRGLIVHVRHVDIAYLRPKHD